MKYKCTCGKWFEFTIKNHPYYAGGISALWNSHVSKKYQLSDEYCPDCKKKADLKSEESCKIFIPHDNLHHEILEPHFIKPPKTSSPDYSQWVRSLRLVENRLRLGNKFNGGELDGLDKTLKKHDYLLDKQFIFTREFKCKCTDLCIHAHKRGSLFRLEELLSNWPKIFENRIAYPFADGGKCGINIVNLNSGKTDFIIQGEYPHDLVPYGENSFLCTYHGKLLLMSKNQNQCLIDLNKKFNLKIDVNTGLETEIAVSKNHSILYILKYFDPRDDAKNLLYVCWRQRGEKDFRKFQLHDFYGFKGCFFDKNNNVVVVSHCKIWRRRCNSPVKKEYLDLPEDVSSISESWKLPGDKLLLNLYKKGEMKATTSVMDMGTSNFQNYDHIIFDRIISNISNSQGNLAMQKYNSFYTLFIFNPNKKNLSKGIKFEQFPSKALIFESGCLVAQDEFGRIEIRNESGKKLHFAREYNPYGKKCYCTIQKNCLYTISPDGIIRVFKLMSFQDYHTWRLQITKKLKVQSRNLK